MDEKELLRIQIKSYEFYARLIERAVGGGTSPRLPRWDEQRALEYRELAEQLRRRLAELEAQDAAGAANGASSATSPTPRAGQANQAEGVAVPGDADPASSRP